MNSSWNTAPGPSDGSYRSAGSSQHVFSQVRTSDSLQGANNRSDINNDMASSLSASLLADSKWQRATEMAVGRTIVLNGKLEGAQKELQWANAGLSLQGLKAPLESMVLLNMKGHVIDRLVNYTSRYFWTATMLQIEVSGTKLLERIDRSIPGCFANVQNLTISCNFRHGCVYADEPPLSLVCLNSVPPRQLQSLEVNNVDFRIRALPTTLHFQQRRRIIAYASLKSLKVHGCIFDALSEDCRLQVPVQYPVNQLHSILIGAPALEYLEVSSLEVVEMTRLRMPARITLSNLRKLVVLPPAIWSIDVLTPNLESFTISCELKCYLHLVVTHHLPLIPAIDGSMINRTLLFRLKHVELRCYEYDDRSRLEEWLRHLANVTKLAIIADKVGDPWPCQEGDGPLENRARMCVLEALNDHPEWCPKLEDLTLHACFASGNDLVKLVRKRTEATNCATLQRVVLKDSIALSLKALVVLYGEVPLFVHSRYDGNFDLSVSDPARDSAPIQYMLDDFLSIQSGSEETEYVYC